MILQRAAFYPQQRFDIPDARAIEAFGQNDWIYFLKGVLTSKSLVVSGFEVTNYQNIFTVPGVLLSQNNVAMLHPESSTQAAGFYISSGTEADYRLVLSSNNAGLTTNYVEVDLDVATGSPDTRAFWDSGANAGQGAEFTDTVDTVINLSLKIETNISGFTSGRIPLYKIVTNPDGTVNSLTDCRPMLFRLATGGNSPNPSADYLWSNSPDAAHSRLETPVTATSANTSNAPFQGGDKNIKTLKNWMDAVMTLFKETNGTPYWYMKPQGSLAGVYQNAVLTMLQGGTYYHGRFATVASSTTNTVVLNEDAQFTNTGAFDIGANHYSYTGYNAGTKTLTGVTPNPTAHATSGAIVQQAANGTLALRSGSTVVRMGQTNSTLQPFNYANLSTNNTLFVFLTPDGAAASYGMGDDSLTPIVPKDVSALTSNSITVATGGNYVTSGGNLLIRGQQFAYASYNASTGLFTSVSPDPSGIVQVGDTAYQDNDSGIGYYHASTSQRVPGTIDGVSEGVERVFWLAHYDGTNTMFIRDSELVPGESAAIGDDDSEQLYQYIGSTGASDNFPIYDVNTIPNGTNLTEAIKTAFEIIEVPIYDEKVPIVESAGTTSVLSTYGLSATPLDEVRLFAGQTQGYTTQVDAITPFSPASSGASLAGIGEGIECGQTFTLASSIVLGKIKVIAGTPGSGTPTIPIVMDIYASDGTKPTGVRLYTSEQVAANQFFDNNLVEFTFTGAGNPTLSAGNYAWVVRTISNDGSGSARLKSPYPNTYPSYGNIVATTSGIGAINAGTASWSTNPSPFYYEIDSMSLTGGTDYWYGDLAAWSGPTDSIKVKLKKIGNPVADIVVQLWSSTGAAEDPPNAVLLTSDPVPASSLSNSFADVEFTFSQTTFPSGIRNFVIKPTNITTLNANNNIAIEIVATGSGIGRARYTANHGTNWIMSTYPAQAYGYNIPYAISGTVGSSSGLVSGDTVFLPVNSKTSQPQMYSLGTDELEVFENGVLLQKGYDYNELTNTSIEILRTVLAGSYLRFRVASIGGAGGTSAGGGGSSSLQTAYQNGRTITVAPGQPVVLNGPSGQKLLQVHGDVQIDGLLDPTGLELTPQSSNPIPNTKTGIWVDDAQKQLQYTRPNGTVLPIGNILESLLGGTPSLSRAMVNNTGATIPANSPVYFVSGTEIGLADADNDTASRVWGITKTAIPNGSQGEVIYFGFAQGAMQDTGLASGTRIWLGSTPGELTQVPPSTPGSFQIQIGLVAGNDLFLQIENHGQLV